MPGSTGSKNGEFQSIWGPARRGRAIAIHPSEASTTICTRRAIRFPGLTARCEPGSPPGRPIRLRLTILPMLWGHRPASQLPAGARFVRRQLDYFDFSGGTLAPFFRASESPIAIACFLLFTTPPLPPFPERSVPRFFRRIADRTDLLAAFPYLAICPSCGVVPVALSS